MRIFLLTCQSGTIATPKHQQKKDATQHHLEILKSSYSNQRTIITLHISQR